MSGVARELGSREGGVAVAGGVMTEGGRVVADKVGCLSHLRCHDPAGVEAHIEDGHVGEGGDEVTGDCLTLAGRNESLGCRGACHALGWAGDGTRTLEEGAEMNVKIAEVPDARGGFEDGLDFERAGNDSGVVRGAHVNRVMEADAVDGEEGVGKGITGRDARKWGGR